MVKVQVKSKIKVEVQVDIIVNVLERKVIVRVNFNTLFSGIISTVLDQGKSDQSLRFFELIIAGLSLLAKNIH